MDGRLVSRGLNLHHSLDDGLNEELVLGLHVLSGSSDLLSEGDERGLELDEVEFTEIGIVVVSLSIIKMLNSLGNDGSGISVVINFNLVSLVEFFEVSLVTS